MAQTGFTPLLIYSSSTATNAPTAGNLLNNATGSELAINIADGKLFYKDSSNAVQVIGWKVRPATAGGTGLTSFAVGDLIYADTTTTLAKLADVATGNALISGGVGVAPSYGKIGLTTHVSGTLPVANGGTNLTSFTNNGVLYASSTSALATSSALTFDGTNLSTTGYLTATSFRPSSSTVPTNGLFLPLANTLGFATNSAEIARFDSSGNFLVGTTTTSGSVNNNTQIVGGIFSTSGASGISALNATPTTLVTLPNISAGCWLISATLPGQGATAAYSCVAIVTTQGTTSSITTIKTATLASLSLSGLAVQITQVSGGTQGNCAYTAIRLY